MPNKCLAMHDAMTMMMLMPLDCDGTCMGTGTGKDTRRDTGRDTSRGRGAVGLREWVRDTATATDTGAGRGKDQP